MITTGLADFGTVFEYSDGPVWPSEGHGPWLAPATELRLAETDAGHPAFRITFTRPAAPFLPPDPFGMLDLTVQAVRETARIRDLLREARPGATLVPLMASCGRFRLDGAPGAPELASDIADPADLVCTGSGLARFVRRLSIDSAGLLEGMLFDGLLPIQVTGALGFDGLSPRLQMTARFDPAALLEAISAGAETREALCRRLGTVLSTMPIQLDPAPDPHQHEVLADALADRLVQRFGQAAGSDATGMPLHTLPAEIDSGRFIWDLGAPFPATRWIPLSTDPFEALRTYLTEHGHAALVERHTVTPLPRGTQRVRASTVLPADTLGSPILGLTLTAPAWPPHRPSPAIASATLTPPSLEAELQLRLAPGEPLSYDMTTFAVLTEVAGVRRIEGPVRHVTAALLTLSPADFGLTNLVLEATQDLLELASLSGEIGYTLDEHALAMPLRLDADHPRIALALPETARDGRIHLTATASDGSASFDLPQMPLRSLRIDLALFPGHGPQTAQISAELPAPDAIVVLDVIAETAPESTSPVTLAFREGLTTREWRYLSRSPFAPGFRWRRWGDSASGQWQHHPDPKVPLHISDNV